MNEYDVQWKDAPELGAHRAVRLEQANLSDVAAWCDGEVESRSDVGDPNTVETVIRPHNKSSSRPQLAAVGDWIVRDEEGVGGSEPGYLIYRADQFAETFEPAP